MQRFCALLIALLWSTALGQGQQTFPSLYIVPSEDGFETYLTAAMHKKDVPVQVVVSSEQADYTLAAAKIETKQESTGGKIARCLFAYCAGIDDKSTTAVTLVSKDGVVAWSYSVNKGRGSKNMQSMAEAIAKHLKSDYLKKRHRRSGS